MSFPKLSAAAINEMDKMSAKIKGQPTIEEMKSLVEQHKKTRVKRCEDKINRALEEERCILDVSVLITGRGNMPQLNIVAQD